MPQGLITAFLILSPISFFIVWFYTKKKYPQLSSFEKLGIGLTPASMILLFIAMINYPDDCVGIRDACNVAQTIVNIGVVGLVVAGILTTIGYLQRRMSGNS